MRGRSFCKTVLINFGFPGWNATVKLLKTRLCRQYNCKTRMAHPLQPHYVRVSALLRELRAALENHPVFRSCREAFDEYLEANELELALHSACDALLESPYDKPSAEVIKKIEDAHKAMDLRDDCVERLLAF
jgi:hypothetical protein